MTTSTSVEWRRVRAHVALTLSTILCSGLAAPAFAQTNATTEFQNIDANGVDVVTGGYNYSILLGSIGSGPASLSMVYGASDFANGIPGLLDFSGFSPNKIGLTFGTNAENFTLQGGVWVPREGSGATITGGGDSYTYRTADGTSIVYGRPDGVTFGGQNTTGFAFCGGYETQSCRLVPLTKTLPDGRTQHYHWTVASVSGTEIDPVTGEVPYTYFVRLSSIVNETGFLLKIKYATDTAGGSGPSPDWFKRVSVKFVNQEQEYCDPDAANCDGLVQSWPTATISYPSSSVTQITDSAGGVWRLTAGSGTFAVKRPGSSSDTTSVTNPSGIVSSITTNGITTSYSRSVTSGVVTMVRTNAASNMATFLTRLSEGRPYQVTNEAGETTAYTYDTSSRPTDVTDPQGIKQQFTYDTRGNVTQKTIVAKSGSGLASIVTTANYDATCANTIKCNQPNWTRDALGNQTDYSYDPTSGLLTSFAAPSATTGASRPTTTLGYASLTGYAGVALKVVSTVSACASGSSCSGTANEVRTTLGFGTLAANNLQPVTVARGAGDGSLTATTTNAYDKYGNVVRVDGPLAGTDDTTTYRYDAGRRLVGVISADPDGSGALKRRATRAAYNADGQVTVVEAGTVNGTSDSDWAAFASAQQATATYDANARKTKDVTTAGGTTYQVVQYSYDVLGRLDCSALRMNSTTWGALPTSACTLGTTGIAGPDRIGKTTYDAVGRPTKTQSAYGTSDVADDATGSYTTSGKLATLTDAVGNKTTYEYDGFDRLSKTRYPVAMAGSGTSSTTDYEQLGYDANSNVTSRRLQDAASIGYSYDALNRLTVKDLPGSELDATYTYDLLSRPLSAATSAQTLSFTYDALSRNLTQSGPLGTTTIAYDLAGRRTRFTWPDAFYVTYDYLVTDEATAIRENGATSGIGVLATFGYDDLGRRVSLTRGNGTTTTYTPDAVSRLSSLAQNLSGTTNDLTLGFTYNPASQIASATRSNDGYAWAGAANRDDASSVNGLNQVTTVGTGSLGYDARGNLTSTGSSSYAYSSENLLLTGPSSAAFLYDPLLRLYQESGASVAATLFQYDGQALIGEYNGSTVLQKRYVHGPGSDEPLVEYDRSGSTFVRAWHHADERGSVITLSDDSGVATTINTYDEYGVPGSSNVGRFQYTGQTWLPSVGLYYYKARMYASRLGRFMQTDPIGYGDGMNWYAYVGGDPVNTSDPSGLKCKVGEEDINNDGCADIIVTGSRPSPVVSLVNLGGGGSTNYGIGNCAQSVFPMLCNGEGSGLANEALPQNMQPQMCPIAYTPQGDTKGDNPSKLTGGEIQTDLPGGWADANAVFEGLTRLAGDTDSRILPNPLTPNIFRRSYPSGIQLRIGTFDTRPRIDIPRQAGNPNFPLRAREVIHFTGGKGNMCPTK